MLHAQIGSCDVIFPVLSLIQDMSRPTEEMSPDLIGLMLSTPGKISSRQQIEIFFFKFSKKIRFDISYKFLQICIKKNKKKLAKS